MKKISILIFLVLIPIFSFAKDDSLTLGDIDKRLSLLEQYKENMASEAKIEYNKSIKEIDEDVSEKTSTLIWTFGSFAVLALAALGINALNYWKINEKINKKVNEKIEEITERKREDIISVVKDEEYERRLKQIKKILVISSSSEAQDQVKHTFDRFDFKNVKFRIKDNFQTIPENDIIVFNNLNGELEQEYIDDIVEQIGDEDKCYIGYTTANLARHEQFNFANSRFTLYNNLLNTLKFADLHSQI